MKPIKPIRNEADYELALQEIDHCLDAASGSPERDRLEVLTVLVDDYEAKHHPISPPEPIAAIEFVLEQRGLSRKDLIRPAQPTSQAPTAGFKTLWVQRQLKELKERTEALKAQYIKPTDII